MAVIELIIKGVDQASGVLGALNGPLDRMHATFGSLSGLAGGALLTGVGALGASLVAGGAAGLSFNNQMEQARAKLNAFNKDATATNDDLAYINAEAAKTPFAFGEMVNAFAGLKPAAKSANMDVKDLLSTAEVLAASNPAEGLEGAAFALREATSGDFTSAIERFNLPRQYINQLKAEGVPNIEIVNRAMQQMGYDMDLVSAMATTADGRMSTFQDSLTMLAGTITQPIFDAFSSGLGSVNAMIAANQPTIQAFAETLAGQLGNAVQWLTTNAIPLLTSAWEQVQPGIASVISLFQQALPAIQPLIALIGANLQPILIAVAGLLGGAVVAAIASAVAAFVSVAAPIAAMIAIGAVLVSAWQSNFGGIRDVVTQVMGNIQTTFVTVVGALRTFWQQHGTQIMAIATTVFGYLQTFIGGVLQVIAGIFNTVLAVIRGDWGGAMDGLRQAAEGLMTALGTIFDGLKALLDLAFTAAIGAAKQVWEGFVSDAKTIGRNIIDGIVNGVKNGVGALKDAVRSAAQSALDAAKSLLGISSPSRVFQDEVGAQIPAGIVNGILSGMSGVIDTITGMTGKGLDAAKKAVADLAKQIADLARGGLAGSASLDRSRAGALGDLAGLVPSSKAIDDVGKRIADVNQHIEATKRGLASSDAAERAAAAQQLGDLFTQRQQLLDQQTQLQQAQERTRQIAADAQQQLQQADAEAAKLRATDPKLAADYFDLRRKQIIELAKLQQDAADATSETDRARIQEQISLITAAQQAELQGFQSDAAQRQREIANLVTLPSTTNAAMNELLQQLRDMLLPLAGAMQQLGTLIPDIPTTPTIPGAQSGGGAGLAATPGPSVTFAAGAIVVNGGSDVAAQVEKAVSTALAKAGLQADARRRSI